MDNLNLYTQINSLPTNLKEEAKDFVEFLKTKSSKHKKSITTRKFGILKGKIELSSDFDSPLADFKEYM